MNSASTQKFRFGWVPFAGIFATLILLASPCFSNPAEIPEEMKKAQITEKLGSQVAIDSLQFVNEAGQKIQLSDYFKTGKPVLLTMVYYQCPGLCSYLLNGFTNSIRSLRWAAGNEFSIVTVSINPNDTPALAAAKKANYIKEYGRLTAAEGWHFLTGTQENIQKLADQVGFGFFYDKVSKEYAHSAGVFVLTPTGKISRVLYGIDFPHKDLRLSLLEAGEGKIGTIFERALMFCYHYDPLKKGYSVMAFRVVQAGGVLAVLLLAIWMAVFWIGQVMEARRPASEKPTSQAKESKKDFGGHSS